MWWPWSKSIVKIHDTYSPTRTVSPSFSCSSFKDIQHLCADDPSSFSSALPNKASRVFHRVRVANSVLRSWPSHSKPEPNSLQRSKPGPDAVLRSKPDRPISIPGAENSIVLYFTSLRVVRSTFENCRAVRAILRGFRVRIDERDLSMDSSFATELQRILGGQNQAKVTLPRVFIGGRYVGGSEEVKQLHEIGELKKLVQGLPAAEPGVCDGCGGYGFVQCNNCHGRHKLYTEKKAGFRSCAVCNENGLIRCPSCSSAPL